MTYPRVEAEGRGARAEVRFAPMDVAEAVGAPPDALAAAPRAADHVRARLTLTEGGRRCAPAEHAVALREGRDGFELVISLRYECPHAVDDLALRYHLFFDVDARHLGMATLRAFGSASTRVFVERDRRASLRSGRPLTGHLAEHLRFGVEHIFLGYDHLALLFGLLVVTGAGARRDAAREAAIIVSSFTRVHSLTLVRAALGWVALPPSIVEPAIALSIAYVAAENHFATAPRGRRALTFAFGLVHGFSFAGVLAEQGLPPRGRWLPHCSRTTWASSSASSRW